MARAEAHYAARQVRYRSVAEDLLAQIKSGRFEVGATLPGELELLEHYKVSRHTMRAAMRVLADLGLIERRARAGTVVKAAAPEQSYMQVVRSPAELLQYPADSRLRVLGVSTLKANQKLARVLQCRVGEEWCRVQAVRRFKSSGVAICWVDLFLLPEFSGIVKSIGRRPRPVYEIIEQRYGEQVTAVRVGIGAGLITADVAVALHAEPGTPSLRVVRRYIGRGGRAFQISVSEHPADRYNYQIELKRGWPSAGSWSV
jgi:GntR family transcriptional regulator